MLKVYLILFFLSYSIAAFCQGSVNGIVMDSATFSPLPFVSIGLKNTSRGTTSDSKGNFEIIANYGDTLAFSFLGYKPLELVVLSYESGLIRMAEKRTILKTVIIRDTRINPYEGLFSDQNKMIESRHVPFYYSKSRKEKARLRWFDEDIIRTQNYVDLLVKNSETKNNLMDKYSLTEGEYYEILTKFNVENETIMYFLSGTELLSLLNNFFSREAAN